MKSKLKSKYYYSVFCDDDTPYLKIIPPEKTTSFLDHDDFENLNASAIDYTNLNLANFFDQQQSQQQQQQKQQLHQQQMRQQQ